jgi:hypothetical protein
MNKAKILIVVLVSIFISLVWFQSNNFSRETSTEENPSANSNRKPDVTGPETIRRLKTSLARLRGLEFKEELKIGVKARTELKAKMQEQAQKEGSEEYEKIRKALIKLGFIQEDFNIRQFMIDLYTEQIWGFYDPSVKELYLVSAENSTNTSIENLFGVPMSILTTIHEVNHALQDQHFDLVTLPTDEMINDDLASAVKSLIEGEATFVMYDYLLRQRGLDLVLLPDITESPETTSFSDRSLIDKAPLYIKEGILFPYNKGLEFVKFVKARGGWEAVNQIYHDLPASTEQILHPQKYLMDRDYPTTITIPDVTSVLTTSRWSFLLENVMGELNVGILKKQFFPTLKGKRMSEGWDGDKFIVWENIIDKYSLLVWFTTWDTEQDAREFYNAYQKLIPQKYTGTSYEFPKATLLTKEPYQVRWKLERQLQKDKGPDIKTTFILMEHNKEDVLVIEDAPEDVLYQLSKTIWKNVQKEELKEVKRILSKPPPEREKPAGDKSND